MIVRSGAAAPFTRSVTPEGSQGDGLAGYAGIISRALLPLNTDAAFKKRFARYKGSFILDSPHWLYAAWIVIDTGRISVQGLEKEPHDVYRDSIDKAGGYLQMGTYDYLSLARGHLSVKNLLKKWLIGEIRVKNPFGMLRLLRIYKLLSGSGRKRDPTRQDLF